MPQEVGGEVAEPRPHADSFEELSEAINLVWATGPGGEERCVGVAGGPAVAEIALEVAGDVRVQRDGPALADLCTKKASALSSPMAPALDRGAPGPSSRSHQAECAKRASAVRRPRPPFVIPQVGTALRCRRCRARR